MAAAFGKGDHVRWNWGAHSGEGVIAQVFTRRVKRTIKGAAIVRNATEAEPAYLVRQHDGGRVLKGQSELEKA